MFIPWCQSIKIGSKRMCEITLKMMRNVAFVFNVCL